MNLQVSTLKKPTQKAPAAGEALRQSGLGRGDVFLETKAQGSL